MSQETPATQSDDFTDAHIQRLLRKAVHIEPRNFWAWFVLGTCYDRQGQDGRAEACYQTCTTLWPEFHWAYFSEVLGMCHSQGGWVDRGADAYTYFRGWRPVARAGYSIHVYHVSAEEAERVPPHRLQAADGGSGRPGRGERAHPADPTRARRATRRARTRPRECAGRRSPAGRRPGAGRVRPARGTRPG